MFLLNSRLGLFSAAYFRRHPFSRSYGVNLPSSLTTLLPLVLGFSPHPPVSVCGTDTLSKVSWLFLSVYNHLLRYLYFAPLRRTTTNGADGLCSCVPNWWRFRWLRNFNRMCIDYAFRPRLSSRLTLRGRTFLKKPWVFDHYDSHIILATHSGILTCMQSTTPHGTASPRIQRSPTPESNWQLTIDNWQLFWIFNNGC